LFVDRQDLPAAENQNIDDGFFRDVLPVTEHSATLSGIKSFDFVLRAFISLSGISLTHSVGI
jgi:hypothetical protein